MDRSVRGGREETGNHEDDILREVRKLNAVRRVAIHTISVGVESSLMRKLAEENGGTAVVVQ